MKLRELQTNFFGHATGLVTPAAEPSQLFVGTPELSAQDRISIYADMYVWRLIDAVRGDYPALCKLLGDEASYALLESYARAHPSVNGSLTVFGRHLEAFLRSKAELSRPDLPDLARLEWAKSEIFEAESAETWTIEELLALGEEKLPTARLTVVPALRVVSFEHDVDGLWRALTADDAPSIPEPLAHPTKLVIWRKGFDVFHAALSDAEAQALERAIAAEELAVICEAFAEADDPAAAAMQALAGWFSEGFFRRP